MSAFGSIDGPINLGYQLWVVGRSYVWNQWRQIVWWSSKLVFWSSKFSLLLLHCHLHDHTVLQVIWCKDANPRLFTRFHKFHRRIRLIRWLRFHILVVLSTSESKILQLVFIMYPPLADYDTHLSQPCLAFWGFPDLVHDEHRDASAPLHDRGRWRR